MNGPLLTCVVITYGHDAEVLQPTLDSIALFQGVIDYKTVIIDDASGRPPTLSNVEVVTTDTNIGYAGAAMFAADAVATGSWVLFVNPDAVLSRESVQQLAQFVERGSGDVAVPSIISADGLLENVRSRLSILNVLGALVLPRAFPQTRLSPLSEESVFALGMPWVPAGTVLLVKVATMQQCRLRPEMFWVEMSAWSRDFPEMLFTVLPGTARHTGGSTEAHASSRVSASLLQARLAYISAYGGAGSAAIAKIAATIGLLAKWASRSISSRDFGVLLGIVSGRRDWRQA